MGVCSFLRGAPVSLDASSPRIFIISLLYTPKAKPSPHSSSPPSPLHSLQLWDHNPNLLHNRGVAEASYILLGSTVAASLAAGFVTLSAVPDAEEKKK